MKSKTVPDDVIKRFYKLYCSTEGQFVIGQSQVNGQPAIAVRSQVKELKFPNEFEGYPIDYKYIGKIKPL